MSNSKYFQALCDAMSLLDEAGGVFIGQSVRDGGTALSRTLEHISTNRRIEMPVAENMQCGMCHGIALAGGLPVSVYPRIDFLIEAVPQLVQHLDKWPAMGGGRPRVIIRTAIATDKPLDPGPQHTGSYTQALAMMLRTVMVFELTTAEMIVPFYRDAMEYAGSTILVEHLSLYDA